MPSTLSPRVRAILPGLLATALLVAASPATATVPSDLCSGNPCVVNGTKTVDAGSVLDFGAATDLRFAPSAVVTIGAGADPSLQISAGTILLQGGATIRGGGDLASVTLTSAAGNIELQRSGSNVATVDVSGNQAGSILLSSSGDAIVAGNLDAHASGRDSQGGTVEVDADGQVSGAGSLLANASGNGAGGGGITVQAGTGVNLTGTLSVAGSDFGGGDVSVDSTGGDVALAGTIGLGGGSPDGSGGSLEVGADAGNVALTAALSGTGGTGSQQACGDGASITIDAALGVSLGGAIDVSSGTQCFGGEIDVTAGGDIRQLNGSTIKARGPGAFGSGGDVSFDADGAVIVRDVDLTSSGFGGSLEAIAGSDVTLRGLVDASATGSGSIGGTTFVQGCNVAVIAGATLDTRGSDMLQDFGINTLRASGGMTVAGTLRAAAANVLQYKGSAPQVTGTVAPAATITLDPTLPDCPPEPACGNGVVDPGEACDDGNTVSCDGCSADCQRVDAVCGDGVKECGEQCDDGNLVDGDGCESDCTLTPPAGVRLRGVPLETSGCLAEWALTVPSPATDPDTGLPAASQRCTDGDPSCDADGTVDGVCTFDVKVCVRVPDPEIPACAPTSVKMLDIDRPKPPGGSDPVDQANAAALASALQALGVKVKAGAQLLQAGKPVRTPDACTPDMLLRVPHGVGASAARTFRIAARGAGAPNMQRNGMVLTCDTAQATCGDGIVQSGEGCDDGNTDSCDGCSATCQVEGCGNGTVDCGEECDLGAQNGQPDSSCSATCTRLTPDLRIPGDGARRTGCAHEWSMLIADQDVPRDRNGIPRTALTCTDNDPSCDLDPTPGVCRLRIWSCFGGADERLGCTAQRVSGAVIQAPKASVTRAPEVAARSALTDALAAFTFPSGPGESCTGPVDLTVPVRQAWLDIRLAVPLAVGHATDRDTLRLRCAAAPAP